MSNQPRQMCRIIAQVFCESGIYVADNLNWEHMALISEALLRLRRRIANLHEDTAAATGGP